MLALIDATNIVELAYMAASLLFILGILKLGKVKTSKQGNQWAAYGMALAIGATMLLLVTRGDWDPRDGEWTYQSHALAVGAMALGSAIGWWMAVKVPMTSMPEFVAFFNGLGGAASMFVALAEVPRAAERSHTLAFEGADFAIAVSLAVLIGAVTLTGSLVAYAKLAGKLNKSRIGPLGSQGVNAMLGLACIGLAVWGGFFAETATHLWISNGLLAFCSLLLGVGLTLPIGGADMPVAIALLNSYSGIAGMTTGFILKNNLLIVAGSLVGASGIILTQIMCKAMNRSLSNVLLGGMGEQAGGGGSKDEGYTKVKSTSGEELAAVLDAATSVIFVPGYGLAVAQAQHKVRELAGLLEKKGCQVRYAIHPVAGRMPGHMNILLAEADVPYEQLYELDRINDDFKNTDVVVVLGANDVCNPAATNDPKSPIAGMPVLTVWDARTVVVVKRSLASGYAGIRNELFQMDNSLMFLADAKKALEDTITELKAL
ncbi:MAG: NAD(P)(+) transhydrogenase (Re/Si-specific) subunit beta [Planctomycetaceae bacterium]|jgi:NAD(P) transhydrogenase subunit beta|nr:NAD(P)(+) transhydrogenase (Re/Si-specific) subunit beta [Planctomycetaceae bacterium]